MQGLDAIHVLDIVVLGVLLVSAIAAYTRGFVKETLSLLSWVGAAFATWYFYEPVRAWAREIIPIDLFADIGAGLAIFLGTLFLLSILTGRISTIVGNSQHGALDRSVGFVFGLARGAFLLCFAYIVVSWMVPVSEHPAWLTEARTTPLIREGAIEIEKVIPSEWARSGSESARQVNRTVRDAAETEALLRRMNNPAPAVEATKPAGQEGRYTEEQRRELDEMYRQIQ